MPYSDPELNSPLVNNPAIVKIKVGDRLTLKEGYNKNEPRFIYRVLDIDFKLKTVKIIKESRKETVEPKPRVISFALIDRIFSKSNLFTRFDGYDEEINCSYSEWDEMIQNIDRARSQICPINLSNEPWFHASLMNEIRTSESKTYDGHQSPMCLIEIESEP